MKKFYVVVECSIDGDEIGDSLLERVDHVKYVRDALNWYQSEASIPYYKVRALAIRVPSANTAAYSIIKDTFYSDKVTLSTDLRTRMGEYLQNTHCPAGPLTATVQNGRTCANGKRA